MTDFPPPPELLVWLAGHLPSPVTAADCSWPRATSRVWRLSGPDGAAAFLKISSDDGAFAREVAGYAYAARYLPERQAPRLLASDPGLRALLSTALPGRVVRDLPLGRGAELRLHQDAGRLLRRWHDRSDAGTADHRAAVREAMGAYAREAAQCREALAGQVPDHVLALVDAAAAEIPALADRLPLRFLHGDYATRNWLVDETGQHGLIDFEQARHGPVVEEFVWLLGALWPTRPELRDAFFTGYGRPLDAVEEHLLLLLTVRLGASYLHTGLREGRADLQDRGHLALGRMTAGPLRS
ncbi:Ser/Thr protein kinase RdoA (MazF antagonist) [Kitasatospora herbaricolor]|uniref:aminoglycoside phosphotransferase family protein n=1 Tax=Kitasatospora herbaricolor TaxID=68217 RepID=UPI00174A417B|nr:aminoglycoside phosphotransferase family protein [Kitasatospora herbaricolor]MDQ0305746.1 Ser/Thr protein kinase RdoA (MazF antagonist) [Kitasatospora herbaricolor]